MNNRGTIRPSEFDTLIAITFRNVARDSVHTWICETKQTAMRSLEALRGNPNIEILAALDATIKRGG